jgi:hypothetical protein
MSKYPEDFEKFKNEMVEHVFKDTECWCKPARNGFHFQSLTEATEFLFISWDDLYQCYQDQNPQTVEQLFDYAHHDNYSVVSELE